MYLSNCCGAKVAYIDEENKTGICSDCKEGCEAEQENLICPNCGIIKFDKEDVENIEENGECMICDKLRGELLEENNEE
jgi:Zn finger protein HypA/HybF involved in hydrogenase expression